MSKNTDLTENEKTDFYRLTCYYLQKSTDIAHSNNCQIVKIYNK